MQKQLKALIILFHIFFTSTSCETYVDIEVPPIAPKPVLNCLFTENEAFNIKLCLSGLVNDTSITFIENANVFLYANDEFIEQLTNKGKGLYLSNHKAQKGAMYTIKASIEGYDNIQASDSIPQLVQVSDIYLQKDVVVDIFGQKYDQVTFSIHDPIGIKNFYEVDLYYGNNNSPPGADTISLTYMSRDIVYWLIDDPVLSNEFITGWVGNISFSDKMFEGKKYTMKLPVYNINNSVIECYLSFNIGSEKYYRYKSTIEKHLFNQGGFLYDELMIIDAGNPVEMYTNIENGYGIFAAYLSQEILITDIRE